MVERGGAVTGTSELRRLGVEWVSLAPRYVGRFEKGVDYLGDLAAFEADFAGHAALARAFGPYKLSLHSGSASAGGRAARGRVTVKVLPRPGAVSTAIAPPWASTSALAIARPRPAPPPVRAVSPR